MSSFWPLEILGGSYFGGNLCTPVYNIRLPFLVMMPFILSGPKREEIIRGWRIMHNEDLRKLYLPDIVHVFKSRSMRWPGQWPVWRRGQMRNTEGKNHFGDLGIGGRMILKCILKWLARAWTELIRQAVVSTAMNLRDP